MQTVRILCVSYTFSFFFCLNQDYLCFQCINEQKYLLLKAIKLRAVVGVRIEMNLGSCLIKCCKG